MYPRLVFALLLTAAPLSSAAGSATTAIDPAGNVWITGSTTFVLTTATAFQKTAVSSVCGTEDLSPFQSATPISCTHAFLTKQDPSGNVLYATYLGGTSQDGGTAVTTDAQGNVYVAGYTYSSDFPVTSGVAQARNAGPVTPRVLTALGAPYGPATVLPGGDVFVAKFAADGTLLFSTLLGGSGSDVPTLIAVDSSGSVYVSGTTGSTDFPVTSNAMTSQPAIYFFTRLSAGGTSFLYSTYSFPSILAFDVDNQGRAFLTGYSASSPAVTTSGPYITILDTAAGAVNTALFATLAPKIAGAGVALAANAQGLWLAVSPAPQAFNVLNPNPPARLLGPSYFLALSPDGSRILAETDVNQTQFDSISLDASGSVYAFGHGTGAIPTTPIQLLASPCSGNGGSFVLQADPAGKIIAATYFRQGSDAGVSIKSPGHLVVSRNSQNPLAPSTTVSLDLSSQPASNFGCPRNLASGIAGIGLAPGEVIMLTGTGLGPAQGIGAVPDASGQYPTSLGGVQVLIAGKALPLLYLQANEIHAVAPFALPNLPLIQVQFGTQSTLPLDAAPASVNPGVFSINGQGAIINQDGTVNSPANPARLGSIVSVYCTGTGYLEMPVMDGQLTPLPPPYITTALTPQVTFAGVAGMTLWSGSAPELIFGITQINVQLPASLAAGTALGAVPVILTVDGTSSPSVSISVKP